jgi:hypothetical protein
MPFVYAFACPPGRRLAHCRSRFNLLRSFPPLPRVPNSGSILWRSPRILFVCLFYQQLYPMPNRAAGENAAAAYWLKLSGSLDQKDGTFRLQAWILAA